MRKPRTFRLEKKEYFAFIPIIFSATGILIAAKNARPIQDDYATLVLLSDHGLWGFLKDSWLSHGGNLTPLFINALFLLPSVHNTDFKLLMLLPILTTSLVFLAIQSSFAHLSPRKLDLTRLQLLSFASLVILGFESAFSPQFLEVMLFSSAVLVHLLPVCLFLIAMNYLNSNSPYALAGLAVLGFLSGNCNISESLFISLASLSLLWCVKKKHFIKMNLTNIYVFLTFNLFGSALIVIAPGFWVRATNQTTDGVPSGIIEFILRLVKSFAIFSTDVLVHPMLYAFIVLGAIFANKSNLGLKRRNFLAIWFFAALFISLVFGAAVAYPAWHQSIGIYLITPYLGFLLGDWVGTNIDIAPHLKTILGTLIAIAVLAFTLRAFYAISIRGNSWDENFQVNYCTVISGNKQPLLGTETIYPISNLGIEDVNRWAWMENAFKGWVLSPKFIVRDC